MVPVTDIPDWLVEIFKHINYKFKCFLKNFYNVSGKGEFVCKWFNENSLKPSVNSGL